MQRIAMLGRFQPVNIGHENGILGAQKYGNVCIGIYAAQGVANPYSIEDVDKMLRNVVPEINTFVFHPTNNPIKFREQLIDGAKTNIVYTRSKRAALLLRSLMLDVIYEDRDEFSSSAVRKSLADGTDEWKQLVHTANVKIIEGVKVQQSESVLAKLSCGLYKYNII